MQENINKDAAIDILSLLPHRPPFLLVDGVSVNPLQCQCPQGEEWQASGYVLVREDNPLLRADNSLESVAFAEMLAQCAGALGLLRTRGVKDTGAESKENTIVVANVENNAPPIGYLAAMRPVRIFGKAHVGDRLVFYVRQTASVGAICLVQGKVFLNDSCLAEAQSKIFVQGAQ